MPQGADAEFQAASAFRDTAARWAKERTSQYFLRRQKRRAALEVHAAARASNSGLFTPKVASHDNAEQAEEAPVGWTGQLGRPGSVSTTSPETSAKNVCVSPGRTPKRHALHSLCEPAPRMCAPDCGTGTETTWFIVKAMGG